MKLRAALCDGRVHGQYSFGKLWYYLLIEPVT
jgi:hypothetical protein